MHECCSRTARHDEYKVEVIRYLGTACRGYFHDVDVQGMVEVTPAELVENPTSSPLHEPLAVDAVSRDVYSIPVV